MKKTPESILLDTVVAGCCLFDRRRFPKPGQLIERLPEEQREILRTLTSDQLANIRVDAWELPVRKDADYWRSQNKS